MNVGSELAAGTALRLLANSVHICGDRPGLFASHAPSKEWLHFTVHTPELDVVVNFSLFGDKHERRKVVGRTGCLVHQNTWRGDIDTCTDAGVRVRPGKPDLGLGKNQLTFRAGGFDLAVELEREPIELMLRLEPCTFPAQINNFEVDGSPSLNWLVLPKLRASGFVSVAGKEFAIDAAPAYHDRNWGRFRFGGNFRWEWGYAHAPEASAPFNFVFTRLSDRGRLSDLMRGLFVWNGAKQYRVFSGDELEVRHEGLFRAARPLKLPRVMGLLSPGTASDVPKHFTVRARRGADRVVMTFTPLDLAQVVVPNDDDFGVTVINECRGRVTVEGRLGGTAVGFEASSIFEFLSD